MEFKKNLHYSLDLEMAILGACLIEKSATGRIYGTLEADNFYFTFHQEVFTVLVKMFEDNKPIDLLTVHHEIVTPGENIAYKLSILTNHVVSSAHLEYHAMIIKQMWMQREIIKLTTSGIDGDISTKEQLSEMYKKLQNIQGSEFQKDWSDMSEILMGLYKHRDEQLVTGGMGITTGFKKLDIENGGFSPGQMIVIGARPSVGKSALAGKIALAIAKENKHVGIISLEMNNNEIAARMASLETDISFKNIYRNLITDEAETDRFYKKVNDMGVLPIYISSKTKVNVHEIRAKAMKLLSKNKLDILIIDYLQLVDTETSKNTNRENEVSRMSRGIKLMAMELQIPVIILCQLNRQITNRTAANRHPQLSDLRESGAIEQDADIVMFLHRDWMSGYLTNEQGQSTEFDADLIVRKWRNGATVHVPLTFHPTLMKFEETARFIKINASAETTNYYESKKDEETPF